MHVPAQQQEAEYEAALEQRRREVEAERLRRDLEQLRMVTALSCMPPAPPAPAPSAMPPFPLAVLVSPCMAVPILRFGLRQVPAASLLMLAR